MRIFFPNEGYLAVSLQAVANGSPAAWIPHREAANSEAVEAVEAVKPL